MIKTRFTQNTCISWFLMLDLDFFRFHQAQGTRLRWHMCRRALFSVTTTILASSEMTSGRVLYGLKFDDQKQRFKFLQCDFKTQFVYPTHHPKIALLDRTGPNMTEKCSLATVLHCTVLQITTFVCIVAIDNFICIIVIDHFCVHDI